MTVTVRNKSWHLCLAFLCLIIGPVLSIPPGAAQGSDGEKIADSALTRQRFAFEVLSIRPHKPGASLIGTQYLPDGFQTSLTLEHAIMLAYIPQPGYLRSSTKILHEPSWVANDLYDIDARVAPEDMTAWQQAQQNQYMADSELLHKALQALLKDRCKFAFQLTVVEVPYWDIVVSKSGAKLKATVPGAEKPIEGKTYALGNGFYIQHIAKRKFVGVSMEELAKSLMRLSGGQPVQDKTGLNGRYDFTLPWHDDSDNSPGNSLSQMPIASIGLELKRGRGPGYSID